MIPDGAANDPDQKIRNSMDLHIRGRLKMCVESARCFHIYIIMWSDVRYIYIYTYILLKTK